MLDLLKTISIRCYQLKDYDHISEKNGGAAYQKFNPNLNTKKIHFS